MEGKVMNQTKTQRDDTTAQRDAFEKTAESSGFDTTRYDEDEDPSCYISKSTQSMWKFFCEGSAWQAALSQPAASEEVVEALEALDKAASDLRMTMPLWADRDGIVRIEVPLAVANPFMKASAAFCDLVWKARATLSALPAQPHTSTIKADNTQALYNALERIKDLESELSAAIHDRDFAEKNHARIAADNMRLKERIQQLEAALRMFMEVGDQCSRGYLAKCHESAKAALHTDNSCGIAVNELIAQQSDSQKDGGSDE